MVITDLGVFQVDQKGRDGLTLVQLADGVTVEEIKAKTQAQYAVAPGLA
jgi:3-oxoacid CoA-transferase subunit B